MSSKVKMDVSHQIYLNSSWKEGETGTKTLTMDSKLFQELYSQITNLNELSLSNYKTWVNHHYYRYFALPKLLGGGAGTTRTVHVSLILHMYTNFALVMFTNMYITHFAQLMFTCTYPFCTSDVYKLHVSLMHRWCLHVSLIMPRDVYMYITQYAQVMFTCTSLCTSEVYMYIIMHKWSLHVQHSFCASYVYMYITHFAQEMFTFFFFPFFHISAFFYKLTYN